MFLVVGSVFAVGSVLVSWFPFWLSSCITRASRIINVVLGFTMCFI